MSRVTMAVAFAVVGLAGFAREASAQSYYSSTVTVQNIAPGYYPGVVYPAAAYYTPTYTSHYPSATYFPNQTPYYGGYPVTSGYPVSPYYTSGYYGGGYYPAYTYRGGFDGYGRTDYRFRTYRW